MATETLTRLSYEQFLETTPEDFPCEWVNGEAIPMSPISSEHQDVAGFLLALLRFYVEKNHLGVVRSDPFQMKTGPDLPGRAPDIMFVANENAPRLKRTFLDGPADLVVEIISLESRARDRGDKFYEYEQGGVREYWLLDPARQQAEIYALGADGVYRLLPVDAQGVFHSAVLPGLWMKTEWLWPGTMPPLLAVLREWKII